MEELGALAFEDVSDEPECPSEDEKSNGVEQDFSDEDARDEEKERDDDEGDSEGVTEAVYRMLMARCILRDPLFTGASAEHGEG